MTTPTETALTSGQANALSGTTDANTGVPYMTIAEAEYYTSAFKRDAIVNRILALANSLRVVKDGALTFGVMPGFSANWASHWQYGGSSGNALTDNAINYVYLLADSTLVTNTTGFPVGTSYLPLATISTSSGAYSHDDIEDRREVAFPYGVHGTVEASTSGSGSPNILTSNENGKTLTNQGASAAAYNTLPAAADGLEFTFVCQDADGIRVTAATGDTIRIAASVSATGGYCECSTIGNVVTLKAINTTEWVATSVVGTWTVA